MYSLSDFFLSATRPGQNILLTTTGEVRLADFGSAKIREESIDKDAVSGTYSYTPLWVAPETLNAKKYDEKVDIWVSAATEHSDLTD